MLANISTDIEELRRTLASTPASQPEASICPMLESCVLKKPPEGGYAR